MTFFSKNKLYQMQYQYNIDLDIKKCNQHMSDQEVDCNNTQTQFNDCTKSCRDYNNQNTSLIHNAHKSMQNKISLNTYAKTKTNNSCNTVLNHKNQYNSEQNQTQTDNRYQTIQTITDHNSQSNNSCNTVLNHKNQDNSEQNQAQTDNRCNTTQTITNHNSQINSKCNTVLNHKNQDNSEQNHAQTDNRYQTIQTITDHNSQANNSCNTVPNHKDKYNSAQDKVYLDINAKSQINNKCNTTTIKSCKMQPHCSGNYHLLSNVVRFAANSIAFSKKLYNFQSFKKAIKLSAEKVKLLCTTVPWPIFWKIKQTCRELVLISVKPSRKFYMIRKNPWPFNKNDNPVQRVALGRRS